MSEFSNGTSTAHKAVTYKGKKGRKNQPTADCHTKASYDISIIHSSIYKKNLSYNQYMIIILITSTLVSNVIIVLL